MKVEFRLLIIALLFFSCKDSQEKEITHRNGEHIDEYSDGKIRFKGNFKDDKMDSVCIWYYNNGVKEMVSNYKKGIKIGDEYKYYFNGSPKEYNFYDFNEELRYRISYDSLRGNIRDEGKPIHIGFNSEEKNHLKNGQTFDFVVLTAMTPSRIIKLKIATKDSMGNISFVKEKYSTGRAPFSCKLKSGKWEMLAISEMYSSLDSTQLIRRDTAKFDFYVNP